MSLGVVVFFSLIMAASTALAQNALPLRVVTFNMFHGGASSGFTGNDGDLDSRLEMAIGEIQALGADVIGLQEVSANGRRGNVAARLAARLGFHYVHAPATERIFGGSLLDRLITWLIDFREGPAIVSRFPIMGWEVYDLPRCESFFNLRVLLRAELDSPWGRLQAFSTHTSRDPCHAARIVEIARSQRRSLPTILMGDFNAAESSPNITSFREAGFIDLFRAANPTEPGLTVWQQIDVPVPTVFRRVDYLFLIPGTVSLGKVRESRVVLNTPRQLSDGKVLWPSDHYGVFADLQLDPRSRN
jgi:endonuclease/exonuclease/phosphatase family metal-dependent hydrolase